MKTVFIHVGPHKTGSTYLQHMFFKHRVKLMNAGIVYPEEYLRVNAHHNIPDYYMQGSSLNSKKDDTKGPWASVLGNNNDMLVSSENFVLMSEAECNLMRRDLPGAEIKVIFFLRDLRRLWPSHWQEEVKHGAVISFLEYITSVLGFTSYFDPRKMDPLHNLRKFQSVFGVENIIIVDYDAALKVGDDIFDLFSSEILKIESFRDPEYRIMPNKSLGFYEIEILRGLNEYHIRETSKLPGIAVRQMLLRNIASFSSCKYYSELCKMIDHYSESIILRHNEAHIKRIEQGVLDEFSECFVNKDHLEYGGIGYGADYEMKGVSRRAYSNEYWWRLLAGSYEFLVKIDGEGK